MTFLARYQQRFELVRSNRKLLNVHVQNVAQIGETMHFIGGTITQQSNDFAFLPIHALPGVSGCGLYDDSGFVVGIVQSTVDKIIGVMIEEGIYSVESLGRIFFDSLVGVRKEPVVTRILLISKIKELLMDSSALGCITRSDCNTTADIPNDNVLTKRPADSSFDRSTEKKIVRIVRDGKVTKEFEVSSLRDDNY